MGEVREREAVFRCEKVFARFPHPILPRLGEGTTSVAALSQFISFQVPSGWRQAVPMPLWLWPLAETPVS